MAITDNTSRPWLGRDQIDRLHAQYEEQRAQQNVGKVLQEVRSKWVTTSIDPNKDPALAMPLATLHDMWLVRWGDAWVSAEALQDTTGDLSWIRAAYRLNGVGKMEHIPSTSHYRLIPLSWT